MNQKVNTFSSSSSSSSSPASHSLPFEKKNVRTHCANSFWNRPIFHKPKKSFDFFGFFFCQMRRKKWKFEAVGIRRLKKRPRETKRVGTRACGHFFSNHVTEPSQWRAPDLLLFPFGPIWRLSRQKLQQQHRDKKGKKKWGKNEKTLGKYSNQLKWDLYIFFFLRGKETGVKPALRVRPLLTTFHRTAVRFIESGTFLCHWASNGESWSILQPPWNIQRSSKVDSIPENPGESSFIKFLSVSRKSTCCFQVWQRRRMRRLEKSAHINTWKHG